MNKYYFALDQVLADLKLKQTEARKRFKFDRKGNGYISRTSFQKLCNRPKQIKMETLNIICHGMGLTPADLWRESK
jgi:DNA-binding Xre family transcriptional regulator